MEISYKIDGKVFRTECTNDHIKVEDANRSGHRTVVVTAVCDLELLDAEISIEHAYHLDDLVMVNGYQSWTETREFLQGEYLTNLRKRPKMITDKYHFKEYGSQAFWNMPAGQHLGFDYAYISGQEPLFIGSFNYKNAYLLIWFDEKAEKIRLQSDCEGRTLLAGESFHLFDYVIDEYGDDYFASFTPVSDKKIFGYTSWYKHYQNINNEVLEASLEKIDPRMQLFQIDDGYETSIGDWMDIDKEKFPDGLSPIVGKIHQKGLMAGIWLAPFLCEEDSKIMREHPDWIAKDEKGEKIYAGCNWSGDCPLDLNNPEVVEYIRKVLRYFDSLGFDFFKFDFLYAVNLNRLKGKTRSETAEFAYGLLREELPGKLLLGSGATLSNCFGRFDYVRIGPDISLTFDDLPYMRFFHPERVSTRVTLLNTIFRSGMNRRMFLNDPDVFLLRDEDMKMTFSQRTALTNINALFGSLLLTSDDVSSYDSKKKAVLENALLLFEKAKVLSYKRMDQLICIEYEVSGETKTVYYDTYRGVLKDRASAFSLDNSVIKELVSHRKGKD